MTWFYASMAGVVIAMVCAAAIRFNGRQKKTQAQIDRAKRLSWIIFALAFVFFIITLLVAVYQ